jgi:hypothetical protein
VGNSHVEALETGIKLKLPQAVAKMQLAPQMKPKQAFCPKLRETEFLKET